jgi:hypothetical protein
MPDDAITRAIRAINPVLEQLEAATSASSDDRKVLVGAAIAAIRTVERRLQEALNGEPLRGMANLATSSRALYAMHVRRNDKANRIFLHPGEKKTYLLLIPTGEMILAEVSRPKADNDIDRQGYVGRGRDIALIIDDFLVEDADLMAEDLPHYLHTIVEAITKHLSVSEGTMMRNRKLKKLADDVMAILG